MSLQYVPYRGTGPAMQDLIGGQIDLACLEASSGLAYVESGKLKAYAVFSDRRPNRRRTRSLAEDAPAASIIGRTGSKSRDEPNLETSSP